MENSLSLILLSLVALAESQRAPEQYHIQTDQGPERFFRFQTESGQYRKEELHPDGSVTGTYGWVDPTGILRLFDYISDAGGYRIEKERLFKVGKSANGRIGQAPANCQSSPELCFEVYPLNLDSDPSFVNSRLPSGLSGPRQLNIIEGQFNPTDSFLVSSLTSSSDISNPISKQNEATIFESDIPLPPPPQRKLVVIGAAANDVQPEPERRSKPFIIGAAGPVDNVSRQSHDSPRNFDLHPNLISTARSGVVIGHQK